MKLFQDLVIKFENPNWAKNPEFGLLDTILENHPRLLKHVESDILAGCTESEFGRRDMPSVEQIFRAAIYKEIRQCDYRELEYHQIDSRICAQFVKIDELRPFSFQMYQKYISKIKVDSLQKLMYAINKIAITEGLEDIEKLRQDSTVIETNIHYPTNNSLVWDCIKESHRLLGHLRGEMEGLEYRDYTVDAKKTFYKINNTKSGDKRIDLFQKQLITFTKCINQVSNIIKKKSNCSLKGFMILKEMEVHLDTMHQVFSMTKRREINGEVVPNDEKIFSIYEKHTDIIVKGSREVKFGHKINLSSGKSNLILTCQVFKGNPSDKLLYPITLDEVISQYKITPRDSATDGGYASKDNSIYAKGKGVANIVFNKIVGSLQNIATSSNMETRLKKWRSGIEANISNLFRGYNLFRCNWKSFEHFEAKVLWSVIAYNVRVMTAAVVEKIV